MLATNSTIKKSHDFPSHHGPAIPELIKIIANILCFKCVSKTPDITFSTSGFVYSNYRQSLRSSRAEGYVAEKAKFLM
jgi:hypothetical protein